MIPRIIKNSIKKRIQPGKVIVLYGPRQVGKTTLVKDIIQEVEEPVLEISGEDHAVHEWLGSKYLQKLKSGLGNYKFLVIDEAQKIPEIGLSLKKLIDSVENLKIIATGSSSFELANQVGEPLVGRKWQFNLFPISIQEMLNMEAPFENKQLLEERLIYGMYPEVISTNSQTKKQELAQSYVDNYLFRDILEFKEIKKSQVIFDLLRMVAFQIGQEVSFNELANSLNVSVHTVQRYVDILEKTFIIKKVGGYSRNLRKEITKNSRIYFYDNGVRNALINNFNPLNLRNDIGQLWENFMFMERLKYRNYNGIGANEFFWRTYDQKEVDLVEERDGGLFGYEFKWKESKAKAPKDWLNTYPEATFEVINKENYLEFVS